MNTHKRTVAVVVLSACLPLVALSPQSRAGDGHGVSGVIYPEQVLPLHFSHTTHLTRTELDCEDCHDRAAESQSSIDVLIPTEAACRPCHAIDRSDPDKAEPGKPVTRCTGCHVGAAAGIIDRVVIPAPNLKFSHKLHIDRGADCRACHGNFERAKIGLATRDQLPRMEQCMACHDGKQAPSECSACHLSEGGGRIATSFESGALKPAGVLMGAAHSATFARDHRAAGQNANYCASCHRKEFCSDCHQGVMKPMDFHGNDYVALHALDARRGNPDCSACHRQASFCVGCHSRAGVSADGRAGDLRPSLSGARQHRFHPEGWVSTSAGAPTAARGPDHHSFEAQRNLRQCASCHRETFCQTCHSAQPGSFRINPHPAGWRTSRRCRALQKRAGRMCLRCHITLDGYDCR